MAVQSKSLYIKEKKVGYP